MKNSIKKIKANKELLNNINRLGWGNEEENINHFINSCKRYVKAIKENRMVCSIDSVSRSGMSRNIKFVEVSKNSGVSNFFWLFKVLGYKVAKNTNYFKINGCGMDMVFHTNYCIINDLKRLNIINKETCNILAQRTPPTI